jgi:hypothetical protein
MIMATDKVMITISGLQDHEVILASDRQLDKSHQVELFQGADGVPGAPAYVDTRTLGRPVSATPEAAGAPQTVEPAQSLAEVEKTAPAPAPAAVDTKKPWEVAAGSPTAVNFRPDMSLHAKMEWVCDNVPKMSRLRILREGAELRCNMLIEKHFRKQE